MNLVGALFPVGKIARATTLVTFEVAEKTKTWKEERKAKKLAAAGLQAQPTGGNCHVGANQAQQPVQQYGEPQYTEQHYGHHQVPQQYGQQQQQQYQYPAPGQQYTYPQPQTQTYSQPQTYTQPTQQYSYPPPSHSTSPPPQHTPTPPPAYSHNQSPIYGAPQKTPNYDVYQPRPYDA